MIKPYTIITALLLFFYSAIYAQDSAATSPDTLSSGKFQDIVITIAGDTIHCDTKQTIFGGPRYKSSTMTDFKKISIKEMKYYTRKNKKEVYKAAILPKWSKPQFLQLVQEGKITLYLSVQTTYGYMGVTNSTTTWYVSKNNDELKELKTSGLFASTSRKKREGIFAEMLADQPDVLKQYEETDSFSFKTLSKIVHLYNTGKPLVD
ncbi:hypothetical protein [Mucilaginibacter terrae]|uniref:TNase-like domain-containing protein n=1 Tax=Mucilaginibacter terrae TaxID=1955052 RepID=A0ABU3GW21_9SPHI|nr:hypothetical protein [Mucilaginibacter terrae]MDT3403968.1 hypothetical protein [Mucilaginibacter terrae]